MSVLEPNYYTWLNAAPPYDKYPFFKYPKTCNFDGSLPPRTVANTAWMIDMATVVYSSSARIEDALDGTSFKDFRFFDFNGTQAFGCRSADAMVISFRGTQSNLLQGPQAIKEILIDVEADAKFLAISSGPDGEKVHTGFFNALLGENKPIWDRITGWIAENREGRKLWFTGHSLGAALATVAAYEYSKGNSVDGLCTFGSPRVGNGNFVNALESRMKGRICRFVHQTDVVTQVPPEVFGYAHTREERYLDEHSSIQGTVPASQQLTTLLHAISDIATLAIAIRTLKLFIPPLPTGLYHHIPTLYAERIRANL